MNLEDIGLKASSLVAGFAGSLVRLALWPRVTLWRSVISVLAGTLCAAYLTPLALHYYSAPQHLENAVAFVLGLVGMDISGRLLRWAKRLKLKLSTTEKDDDADNQP